MSVLWLQVTDYTATTARVGQTQAVAPEVHSAGSLVPSSELINASHQYWWTVSQSVCGWAASSTVLSSTPPVVSFLAFSHTNVHCCKHLRTHILSCASHWVFPTARLNLPALEGNTCRAHSLRLLFTSRLCSNLPEYTHSCSHLPPSSSDYHQHQHHNYHQQQQDHLCSRSLLFPSHGPLCIRLLHLKEPSAHLPPSSAVCHSSAVNSHQFRRVQRTTLTIPTHFSSLVRIPVSVCLCCSSSVVLLLLRSLLFGRKYPRKAPNKVGILISHRRTLLLTTCHLAFIHCKHIYVL